MRRVVCISPHFPPVNAPDMHRLRQALPYLREFGWEPVVFAVDPKRIEGARDELLMRTVPSDVEVRLVEALPPYLTRLVGLGNLGFRSWFPLRQAVSDYLAREGADLVFFTTTVFASIAHGPYWKRRFGVPFVVDLQDPWRNDYYLTLPREQRPPKFWFDHWQKSHLEAATMPHADGMIAVSQAYIDTMRSRYAELGLVPSETLQFGVEPDDFAVARSEGVKNSAFEKRSGVVDVVFAGVVPPSMTRTLRALFLGVKDSLGSSRLRFHFLGTDYAPPAQARERVLPIARDCGVGDMVDETVARLPYFEALRALTDADLLLLLGTDDATYSASKFAQTMLANRPTFSIFQTESNILPALDELGVKDYVSWTKDEAPEQVATRVRAKLLPLLQRLPFTPTLNSARLATHLAKARTGELAKVFDEVLASKRSPIGPYVGTAGLGGRL